MKKYLSVFMIYVRSSFYKFVLLLTAMAAVQTALFLRMPEKIHKHTNMTHKFMGVEETLQGSGLFIVFGVAFVLLTVILCYAGCELSGKQGYTLRRLRIKENKVFLMQFSANTMFYAMFWFCEIVIIRFLMQLYLKDVPEEIYTNQMLMLSFYRNDFLGSLLPLSDTVNLVRNIIWIFAMGASSALFPYLQRRGKIAFSLLIMTAIVLVGFAAGDSAGTKALPAVWAVLIIISSLWRTMRGDYDEKEA